MLNIGKVPNRVFGMKRSELTEECKLILSCVSSTHVDEFISAQ